MPRGDKGAYTAKQKRQARDIEKSYESRGVTKAEAEHRAWATVNKITGGGKHPGYGRKAASKKASKKAVSKPVKKKTASAKKTSPRKSSQSR